MTVSVSTDQGITDDGVLFWGRNGEAAMDKKADGAQMVAVMAAFLTAFATDKILDINNEDFEDERYFICYLLALAMSCSCGFYSLIILTFISVKLKRLTIRSAAQAGEVGGATAEELVSFHGGDFKPKVVQSMMGEHTSMGKHPAFHARHWYNTGSFKKLKEGNAQIPRQCVTPRTLFTTSLIAFKVLCCSFLVAMSVKVISKAPFAVGIAATALLITPTVVAFILLASNGALQDLA